MEKEIVVIFNDTPVGKTIKGVTYERETPGQKEYLFTNLKSGLSVTVFSDDLIVFANNRIQVQIIK